MKKVFLVFSLILFVSPFAVNAVVGKPCRVSRECERDEHCSVHIGQDQGKCLKDPWP